MTVGGYPEASLAKARDRHGDALKLLRNRKDPATQEIKRRVESVVPSSVGQFSETNMLKWANPASALGRKTSATWTRTWSLPEGKHRSELSKGVTLFCFWKRSWSGEHPVKAKLSVASSEHVQFRRGTQHS